MKTIASANSPAIAFSAPGIGLRRRFGLAVGFRAWVGGCLGFGAPPPCGRAPGTSALIGCSRATAGTLQARSWLVGQLSFEVRLTDQSINSLQQATRRRGGRMDFALNEEQQEFKDSARAFARDVIRPAARKHDEEESTCLLYTSDAADDLTR